MEINRDLPPKVGLFGGTFDPIHKGHLAAAAAVRDRLHLAKVLFIPAGQPWLKEGRRITPAEQRLEMVKLAIAGKPYFEASTIEIERPGATYTVDTLSEILKSMGSVEIYVIIGMDTLKDFPRWKDPARLLKLGYLVAVPRPGYARPDTELMAVMLPDLKERLVMLDGPEIDISATEIRQRIAAGRTFADLVPAKVAEYIKKKGLYKTE